MASYLSTTCIWSHTSASIVFPFDSEPRPTKIFTYTYGFEIWDEKNSVPTQVLCHRKSSYTRACGPRVLQEEWGQWVPSTHPLLGQHFQSQGCSPCSMSAPSPPQYVLHYNMLTARTLSWSTEASSSLRLRCCFLPSSHSPQCAAPPWLSGCS